METQAHVEMGETKEERTRDLMDEITEEQFLKDLYLFMRKRDTPIERIPHLGFKQIDLFVMFKTVRELGGYHQVTAQQQWKQVYNRLGGNPRSTSAATCTRRHYEKLLLPYECHKKGIVMNALPQHQPKLFHDPSYNKDNKDAQRAVKRKLMSIPLHQSPHKLQSDPSGNVYPLPLHYSHYYHASPTVLPPYPPISSAVLSSHSPTSPEPQFAFHSSHQNPVDRVKEPLEHLRHLAEQYKTSSGLMEPLNLSVKAPQGETNRNPASSFSPPSSSKNPKFLNKPSPLYTLHSAPAGRGDGCETHDSEADFASYSYPVKEGGGYAIDVNAITAASSSGRDPTPTLRMDPGATAVAQKASLPKTDIRVGPKEEKEGSPNVGGLNLSYTPSNLPHDNGGRMEIQIPLSMFHSWLRQCRSSAMSHGAKQLHTPPAPTEKESSKPRDTDTHPLNLSCHMDPQHWSKDAEDLSKQRNWPSPTATIRSAANHHSTSQSYFTSYRPSPSGGFLKNTSSQDINPFDQQNIIQSYNSKAPHCWDAFDKETDLSYIQVKTGSSPLTLQQDSITTKSFFEDTIKGGKERSDMGPSAVLMLNSSPTLVHLTTEEVMKLKKIISSSS